MNTLYVIRWLLPNGYEISRSSFWDLEKLKEVVEENEPLGWKFLLKEVTSDHWIIEAV